MSPLWGDGGVIHGTDGLVRVGGILPQSFITILCTVVLQQTSDGELQILATEFSSTIQDNVEHYLTSGHSIPAFLSSITLDLFGRQTILSQPMQSAIFYFLTEGVHYSITVHLFSVTIYRVCWQRTYRTLVQCTQQQMTSALFLYIVVCMLLLVMKSGYFACFRGY